MSNTQCLDVHKYCGVIAREGVMAKLSAGGEFRDVLVGPLFVVLVACFAACWLLVSGSG